MIDRHVLITGGGTGIGAALARALDAEGARLTLVGRTPGPLEALAGSLRNAQPITGDVTDENSVAAAFRRWGNWAASSSCSCGSQTITVPSAKRRRASRTAASTRA